ncbi:kinesin-like protein KIFC1 [Neopelma chrysocephalum]|uniref:kinesin-like protein KIFC1 n=1 Tax=Neopelma chrysocephalum TaxID=114329 RepID=UPI000FCD02FF|nr:kinesin-like protein KIFC1 [Neopelma chrysocephalum]
MGSGKTFTMERLEPPRDPESRGMIPRAFQHLFHSTHNKAGSTGFLPVSWRSTTNPCGICCSQKGSVERSWRSDGLAPTPTSSMCPTSPGRPTEEEVLELLQRAGSQRSVARMGLNDRSSRSHSMFQLRIHGEHQARDLQSHSLLTLVDLTGSEHLEKLGSVRNRLRETQSINSSLSALGLIIEDPSLIWIRDLCAKGFIPTALFLSQNASPISSCRGIGASLITFPPGINLLELLQLDFTGKISRISLENVTSQLLKHQSPQG